MIYKICDKRILAVTIKQYDLKNTENFSNTPRVIIYTKSIDLLKIQY